MRAFKTIMILAVLLMLPVTGVASERPWPGDIIKKMEKLMADGNMQAWAGAQPMNTLDDIDRYLDTFHSWGRMILSMDARTNDSVTNVFRREVIKIQTEAFPQLRLALYNIIMEQVGSNEKEISVELKGEDNKVIEFIWIGKFSPPPDFVDNIYQPFSAYWSPLRFSYVNFSKMVSTGKNKIRQIPFHYYSNYSDYRDKSYGDNRDKDIRDH